MIERINLTAAEAREFNETGRVELWTEIEPQPELPHAMITHCGSQIHFWEKKLYNPRNIYIDNPHGPDGERWIAEPWNWISAGAGIITIGYSCGLFVDKKICAKGWPEHSFADNMPREASRANANITTTVEQREGVWGFVTVVEVKR